MKTSFDRAHPNYRADTPAWVIIAYNGSGTTQVWRDFGTAWGSPIYTVLGYFDGSHRDALRYAKTL
jgi:hypothetical protein